MRALYSMILLALFAACNGRARTEQGEAHIGVDSVGHKSERHTAGHCDWPTTVFAGCSGVMIEPRVMLTAAHCLMISPGPAEWAYFGENTSSPALKVAIERCVAHPKFKSPSSDYDIGVCVLSQPVFLLPPSSFTGTDELLQLHVGQSVTLVGFVAEEQPGNLRPQSPTKAWQETVVSRPLGVYTGVLAHAGNLSCSGVSGGPAYVKRSSGEDALLGVVSAAVGAPCGGQVQTTLIAPHLTWINEQIAAAGASVNTGNSHVSASSSRSLSFICSSQ
jgi:secreted trypsin-like serine protease